MYSYKPLQTFNTPDRLKNVGLPRRRFLTAIAIFLSLSIALLIRVTHRRYRVPVNAAGPAGFLGANVPGVVYDKSDEWTPPPNWDPLYAVWDSFPKLVQEYASSVTNLTKTTWLPGKAKAEVYNPYPNYFSDDYRRDRWGQYVPCMGPRGLRLNESLEDTVSAFPGTPNGFPTAPLGSSQEVGLDDHMCFERDGRFGAYGLMKKDSTSTENHRRREVDWDKVDWGSLQQQCLEDNKDRFNLEPRPMPDEEEYVRFPTDSNNYEPTPKARSAIIFRSYDGFKYTSDALRTMRAVIMEMALQSGGEHEAFLLVQVKDKDFAIFDDPALYEKVLHDSVPQEFWNMTVLWNEGLWGKMYPKIPERARFVHVSQWLPVQWLAQQHPNFDFYWNWEMDVRYTGHYYQFAEQTAQWAKKQPRKGLWERNLRFYVPKFHGDFATTFTDFVQSKYERKSKHDVVESDSSIWGPSPPPGQATTPFDDLPPLNTLTPVNDNFTWGVGEEADLITFLPMFNPDTTHYVLRNIYYNYPKALNPAGPPRRATIITFYRVSHRLLSTMHLENVRDPGHHMTSEIWPQGVALHHGFKAVYVPHSIYHKRKWPAKALDFIFNNGDSPRVINEFKEVPVAGEGSGGWESVFGQDREHNFDDSSWYFRSSLSATLYKRLLGYEVEGIGGDTWEKDHGHYCVPPILVHPIKDMEDPDIAAAQEKLQQEAEAKQQVAGDDQKAKDQAAEEAEAKEVEKIVQAADEANS